MEYTLSAITSRLKKNHPQMSDKELTSYAKKYYKEAQAILKMPKAKSAILTITWPRNRTYGNYSAKAELEVTYADGSVKHFKQIASGGGYDKECTAVAAVLNLAARQNLLALKYMPEAAWPFDSKPSWIIPFYEGGTGYFDAHNLDFYSKKYGKRMYGFTAKILKKGKNDDAIVYIKW